MECFDSLIVDVDGVVWRDGAPIEGNLEGLRKAMDLGARVVFLTNNSTRSRRSYAARLSGLLQRPVGEDMVVNSGYSAAVWLRRQRGSVDALIVGEDGLAEEMILQGHRLLVPGDWELADAVVVGLDRGLNYARLAAAHRAILAGALFVATNRDRSFPVPGGTEPGAGSIVALLEASTGRSVDFDAGKPGEWILRLALERLRGATRPLVVGDRVDTDMAMARAAGLPGLLVLTGVSDGSDAPPGTLVAPDLLQAMEEGLVRVCRG